jgi:hypothetical protein
LEIQQLSAQIGGIQAQVHDLSLPSPMVTPRPVAQPPQPAVVTSLPPQARGGYDMAIRMARIGASVEEIAASCGVPRAEARLLRQMHIGAHAA